jgi:DNA-binding NarL/FixJ family response regulator
VHLTRLEHAPVPERPPEPASLTEARRRLPTLTGKQRGLLQVLAAEGGVSAAAARLGTSRGNIYAGLRRIVHRLGVRDTSELLRLVSSGRLLDARRP